MEGAESFGFRQHLGQWRRYDDENSVGQIGEQRVERSIALCAGDLAAKYPQPERVADFQLVDPDDRQGLRLFVQTRDGPGGVGVGRVERSEQRGIGVTAHESPREFEMTSEAVAGSTLSP